MKENVKIIEKDKIIQGQIDHKYIYELLKLDRNWLVK